MNEKDFFKKEPLMYKICYLIGGLFLIINVGQVTSEKTKSNLIFPIIAFSIIILSFIRFYKYLSKQP